LVLLSPETLQLSSICSICCLCCTCQLRISDKPRTSWMEISQSSFGRRSLFSGAKDHLRWSYGTFFSISLAKVGQTLCVCFCVLGISHAQSCRARLVLTILLSWYETRCKKWSSENHHSGNFLSTFGLIQLFVVSSVEGEYLWSWWRGSTLSL